MARTRRYQLTKRGRAVLASGHPWIFRRHLSSAAAVLRDGEWLHLVDGENRVVGYGFYEGAGAIGIRVLSRGAEPPGGAFWRAKLEAALARRASLRAHTNGFRAVHGENDGLPAVTADVYGSVAVVSSYAAGADPLARLAARHLALSLPLAGVLLRAGARRQDRRSEARVLRGAVPELVRVEEEAQGMTVPLRWGQKSGAFLDLRGLRRFVRGLGLEGARVLDLFAYTGTLGAAAETAGASEIWHVDRSRAALELGAAHHAEDASRHRFVEADAFRWVRELEAEERFDLVLSDPPQMTSRTSQVPAAIRAYERLYGALRGHVADGGILVACCCTSRIDPKSFRSVVERSLGAGFRFIERLPPEPDHPVAFPEADYLKVLVFTRSSGAATARAPGDVSRARSESPELP